MYNTHICVVMIVETFIQWSRGLHYLVRTSQASIRSLSTDSCVFLLLDIATAVVKSSSIFRDITSCNPLKFNSLFRGTYRIHLQGLLLRLAISQKTELFSFILVYLWFFGRAVSSSLVNNEREKNGRSSRVLIWGIISAFPGLKTWNYVSQHKLSPDGS
jgi:hypothetical protein